jgi:zinc/manganese transport system ATP-binding protein
MNAPPLLEVEGASVAVRGRSLWHDLTITLKEGEFLAILGPNGVGKSTLLKAVLGLHPLERGTIRVLGHPAGTQNRRMGYVPQRRSFDPSVRVRGVDLVRLGLDGHRWGVPVPGLGRWSRRRREADRLIAETLELTGSLAYAHRPLGEVSGGEQQRLLIAQALVAQPRLLLLDEPLDSLDLPHQAAIVGLLHRVCRDRGVGVVLVAHDVNPILRHLDRVAYLAPGRTASGPPSEVISAETLTELYQTPIEVLHAHDGRVVVVGQPEVTHHAATDPRGE